MTAPSRQGPRLRSPAPSGVLRLVPRRLGVSCAPGAEAIRLVVPPSDLSIGIVERKGRAESPQPVGEGPRPPRSPSLRGAPRAAGEGPVPPRGSVRPIDQSRDGRGRRAGFGLVDSTEGRISADLRWRSVRRARGRRVRVVAEQAATWNEENRPRRRAFCLPRSTRKSRYGSGAMARADLLRGPSSLPKSLEFGSTAECGVVLRRAGEPGASHLSVNGRARGRIAISTTSAIAGRKFRSASGCRVRPNWANGCSHRKSFWLRVAGEANH
jgi:hypothetical protein